MLRATTFWAAARGTTIWLAAAETTRSNTRLSTGSDTALGGLGNDTLNFEDGVGDDTLDGGAGCRRLRL